MDDSGGFNLKDSPPRFSPDHDDQEQYMDLKALMANKNNNRPMKTVVEYYGSDYSHCGYCKQNKHGRYSQDMRGCTLTVTDYQDMLDRYWRRCGNYCYRPINQNCCCPNYAIICDATQFELTKSKRQCIDKMNSFLLFGERGTNTRLSYQRSSNQAFVPSSHKSTLLSEDDKASDKNKLVEFHKRILTSPKAKHKRILKSCNHKSDSLNISPIEALRLLTLKKQQRRVKPLELLPLEDYLVAKIYNLTVTTTNSKPTEMKHRLQISLISVKSKEMQMAMTEEHAVMQKYQKAVHHEDESLWTMRRFNDFLIQSPVLYEPMVDYDHFLKANKTVVTSLDGSTHSIHPLSMTIDLNLEPDADAEGWLVKPSNLPTFFGTYHQLYRLDGELIAVGVLDFLPRCVTTVYFFYDPAFMFLNMGIYSGLIEIAMVRELGRQYSKPGHECPLKHYHLGYYIHECKKMYYKTQFKPSYLLCSETYRYVPTPQCLSLLVDKKYSRFHSEPTQEEHLPFDEMKSEDIQAFWDSLAQIPVFVPARRNTRTLKEYCCYVQSLVGSEPMTRLLAIFVRPYINSIGMDLAKRMIYYISAVHKSITDRACCSNQQGNNPESPATVASSANDATTATTTTTTTSDTTKESAAENSAAHDQQQQGDSDADYDDKDDNHDNESEDENDNVDYEMV